MTPPRSGCLVFKSESGVLPLVTGPVVLELIGEEFGAEDAEMIRHAAAGVMHYFREELGRDSVSVDEFAQALVKVLRDFGLKAQTAAEERAASQRMESDLEGLAAEVGAGFELAFYPRLREEVTQRLQQSPSILQFTGLRSCVKRLTGARRWSGRCQEVHDHIVEYLRHCLKEDPNAGRCALLVC